MNEYCTASTIIDDDCKEVAESEFDLISHPHHYNREGAIECIDEMELVFGPDATAHFCLLNCWKYRYRAGLKNDGYEDLEKSDWYMRKYKELKEKTKYYGSYTINQHDINQINCVPCQTTRTQ